MQHQALQLALLTSTLVWSWMGMQAVHELGHVLGAWATGGEVVRVVIHPATISRTDLGQNPWPLIVSWAGPIVGIAAPLLAWLAARVAGVRAAFLARFFAGFCLIANGLYLGVGSFQGVGDCGDLLRHGAAMWQLWLFGVVGTAGGLLLWHGQGPEFGVGKAACPIDGRLAAGSVLIAVASIVGPISLSGR